MASRRRADWILSTGVVNKSNVLKTSTNELRVAANLAVLTSPFENHVPKPQRRLSPHLVGAGAEGALSLKEETILHETVKCFHPISIEESLDCTRPLWLLCPWL